MYDKKIIDNVYSILYDYKKEFSSYDQFPSHFIDLSKYKQGCFFLLVNGQPLLKLKR